MNTSFYIVIQGKVPRFGPDRAYKREAGSIKATKTRPTVRADEIAIRMEMDVPDSLFFKPTLNARVYVPETANAGGVIDAEVATNIENVIREQMGINLHVSADLPEGQEDVDR